MTFGNPAEEENPIEPWHKCRCGGNHTECAHYMYATPSQQKHYENMSKLAIKRPQPDSLESNIVSSILDEGLEQSIWAEIFPEAYRDLLRYRADMIESVRKVMKDPECITTVEGYIVYRRDHPDLFVQIEKELAKKPKPKTAAEERSLYLWRRKRFTALYDKKKG